MVVDYMKANPNAKALEVAETLEVSLPLVYNVRRNLTNGGRSGGRGNEITPATLVAIKEAMQIAGGKDKLLAVVEAVEKAGGSGSIRAAISQYEALADVFR